MIEIRTSLGVESSVWISGVKLRLPNDHSWMVIPDDYWIEDAKGSDDLFSAFERGLIEVKVTDQTLYPDWYLNVLAPNIRVPEELLEEGEHETLAHLSRLRADAHPAVWTILRREFFTRELSASNRVRVIDFLQTSIV